MSTAAPQQNDQDGDRFKNSLASLRKILTVDKSKSKRIASGSLTDSEGARIKKELKITKDNLLGAEKKAGVLEKKLEETTEQVQRERSLRLTLEKTYEALAKHKQELTAQVDSLLKTQNEQKKEIELLQNSLEKQKDEQAEIKGRLTKRLEILEQEKTKALKEGGELEAKLMSSERKIVDMEKKMESTTRNFDSERKKLEASCENLERSIEVLRGRLVKADATASTLNSDLEAVAKELEETKISLAQSEDQLPQLTQTASRLGEELDTTKSELKNAISAKESFEKAQKEQQEMHTKLQNENETIQRENNDLCSKYDALVDTNKKEMQAGEEKTARLERELKEKEEEVIEKKTKIDSIEKELKAKITAQDTLIQKKDEIVDSLKKTTTSLRQKFNKLDEELTTVRKMAEEKEKELTSKCKIVNEELADAKDELQCAEEEVMKMRTKLSQLEAHGSNTIISQNQGVDKIRLAAEECEKELQKQLSEEQQKYNVLAKTHSSSLQASKETTGKLQQLIEIERRRVKEITIAKDEASALANKFKEELISFRNQVSTKTKEGPSDLGQTREQEDKPINTEPIEHEIQPVLYDTSSCTSPEAAQSTKKRKTDTTDEPSQETVETDGEQPGGNEGLDTLKAKLLAKKAKLADKLAGKGSV